MVSVTAARGERCRGQATTETQANTIHAARDNYSRWPASILPVACLQSHLDSVLNLAGFASPRTKTKERDLLAIAQGSGWVLQSGVLVRSHAVLLCVNGRCTRV
jgi:hypothetical protein